MDKFSEIRARRTREREQREKEEKDKKKNAKRRKEHEKAAKVSPIYIMYSIRSSIHPLLGIKSSNYLVYGFPLLAPLIPSLNYEDIYIDPSF